MQFIYMTLLTLFCVGGSWYWWRRVGKEHDGWVIHVARFITLYIGLVCIEVYIAYLLVMVIRFFWWL